MSEFDVRVGDSKKITSIVFGDDSCETLVRIVSPEDESTEDLGMVTGTVAFAGSDDSAYIMNQSDVENMMMAINKAISLGWLKKFNKALLKNSLIETEHR